MTVLMVLGVFLVGLTGWLVARVIILPRLHVEVHLRHVERYGFGRGARDDLSPVAAPRGWFNAWIESVAERMGGALISGVRLLPALQRGELTAAGIYDMTPEAVHGYRTLCTTFVTLLLAFYALAAGGFSAVGLLLTVTVIVLSWELPSILIRSRGRSRLNAIDRDLPQFLDLVVATVEAGISFGGALTGAASRIQGPLGDELRIAMQQQSLGISSERSLNDMADRVYTPSVRSFARAVIRAESHGVSIGPVLRHLSAEIRNRRRDAAREKVQKAPIKMLFPLVLFILVPLLMVIMFPAMYNILHVLSHT